MPDKKTDLIYAILAMDPYNRGYGTGIRRLTTDMDARLGTLSILQGIDQAGWFERGFYAQAYVGAMGTIVAIRGTDYNGKPVRANLGGSNLLNRYGLALGLPEQGSLNTPLLGEITANEATCARHF